MTNVQRVQLQPAYVISQRPYRDSSAIIELFTQSYGRRSVIARGVKRPGSKFRGLLQPFQLLLVSWVSKTELGTLTDAELPSSPTSIPAKFLPSAFYLNELIQYLLHRDDPHEELFACYGQTLEYLQHLSGDFTHELLLQACLRRFELELMQSIGYGLNLQTDTESHGSIDPALYYHYIIDRGAVRSSGRTAAENPHGVEISGATLHMLADQQQMWQLAQGLDSESKIRFREAKHLLRTVIDFHLGHRTLHSREMYTHALPIEENTSA